MSNPYILVDPSWCDPPHRVTHPEKLESLLTEFITTGWDFSHPILYGYLDENRIQLMTGSHRWCAAYHAGIRIPVKVYHKADVQAAWGDLHAWQRFLS